MASHADADLILRLYDLRREDQCRKARAWLAGWFPASAEEAKAVASDWSRQDNAWLRQITSYWEMAFSLVNTGAIDEDLFARNSGEGVLFCVKMQHLGRKWGEAWPRRMAEAEAFIARNATAQKKAEMFRGRMPA